jgi:hypothetical protein
MSHVHFVQGVSTLYFTFLGVRFPSLPSLAVSVALAVAVALAMHAHISHLHLHLWPGWTDGACWLRKRGRCRSGSSDYTGAPTEYAIQDEAWNIGKRG